MNQLQIGIGSPNLTFETADVTNEEISKLKFIGSWIAKLFFSVCEGWGRNSLKQKTVSIITQIRRYLIITRKFRKKVLKAKKL